MGKKVDAEEKKKISNDEKKKGTPKKEMRGTMGIKDTVSKRDLLRVEKSRGGGESDLAEL